MEIPTPLVAGALLGGFVAAPTIATLKCKNKKFNKVASVAGLGLYCGILSAFTLTNVDVGLDNVVFQMSEFAEPFSKEIKFSIFNNVKDIIQNIAMLVPVGLFSRQYDKSKDNFVSQREIIRNALLRGLTISSAIELSQFMLPILRCTDVRDIILNTASAGLGACSLLLAEKIFEYAKTNDKVLKSGNNNTKFSKFKDYLTKSKYKSKTKLRNEETEELSVSDNSFEK